MLHIRVNENSEDFTIDYAACRSQFTILFYDKYGSVPAALPNLLFRMKCFEEPHCTAWIHA